MRFVASTATGADTDQMFQFIGGRNDVGEVGRVVMVAGAGDGGEGGWHVSSQVRIMAVMMDDDEKL